MNKPLKGEIWLVRLDPTKGHELNKSRPCLIISNDKFNKCAADLVIAVPLTSKNKSIPLHVQINQNQAGLSVDSFIMPEQIRSISTNRCIKYIGSVNPTVLKELHQKLLILLDLNYLIN